VKPPVQPDSAFPDPSAFQPLWDRGEAVDPGMICFTIGDDWLQDRELLPLELRASRAHADGLRRAGLLEPEDHAALRRGLEVLEREHRAGRFQVGPGDEDVHSAVERGLRERIGEAALRLHLGRSRNEQVQTDLFLWMRERLSVLAALLEAMREAHAALARRQGTLPLPGYTHLRRAMPSTLGDWSLAFAAAWEQDREDLELAARRLRRCPLGSGAGYGVPLPLDRAGVARDLGFEGPLEPVTAAQHGRGRAELAFLTVLEGAALDLEKLAVDLWLFSSAEFGFVELPAEWTTGSSLMPHKRNPDILELLRARSRQVVSERGALLAAFQGLPSGYHRDFQLLKPPLFRAWRSLRDGLALAARLLPALGWKEKVLRTVLEDPGLHATARLLEEARQGVPFREAYRRHARSASPDSSSRSG